MAKKQFKAESKRLLDLMINSIYTHKEIFLREIISNASDAIDKLCYLSLTDEGVGMARGDFRIRVTVDEDEGTVTVSDNGIGMSREDMESNLGVIARSGSLKFKSGISAEEALTKATDKFNRRFSKVEAGVLADGKRMEDLSLEELDRYVARCRETQREG